MADKTKNRNSEKSSIHNPKDALFKAFMSKTENAKDFFSMLLPDKILKSMDMSVLNLCPQSFVDNKLKHKHVDVLYQTTFNGELGYVYILTEHQSTPDRNMPFRIMQYIMRIIDHHQKQFKTKAFPLVFPVIYYVGTKKYNYSTNFFDGFGDNKELAKSILTNPFQLTQVTVVTDEDLQKHPMAATLSKIYQIVHERDFLKELMSLRHQFYYLDAHGHSNLILSMLEFMLDKLQTGDAEMVIETMTAMVTENTKGGIMNLSQQLVNKGMQQGMQQGNLEGREEVAISMLDKGMSVGIIAELTHLSVQDIEALKKETQH